MLPNKNSDKFFILQDTNSDNTPNIDGSSGIFLIFSPSSNSIGIIFRNGIPLFLENSASIIILLISFTTMDFIHSFPEAIMAF